MAVVVRTRTYISYLLIFRVAEMSAYHRCVGQTEVAERDDSAKGSVGR